MYLYIERESGKKRSDINIVRNRLNQTKTDEKLTEMERQSGAKIQIFIIMHEIRNIEHH